MTELSFWLGERNPPRRRQITDIIADAEKLCLSSKEAIRAAALVSLGGGMSSFADALIASPTTNVTLHFYWPARPRDASTWITTNEYKILKQKLIAVAEKSGNYDIANWELVDVFDIDDSVTPELNDIRRGGLFSISSVDQQAPSLLIENTRSDSMQINFHKIFLVTAYQAQNCPSRATILGGECYCKGHAFNNWLQLVIPTEKASGNRYTTEICLVLLLCLLNSEPGQLFPTNPGGIKGAVQVNKWGRPFTKNMPHAQISAKSLVVLQSPPGNTQGEAFYAVHVYPCKPRNGHGVPGRLIYEGSSLSFESPKIEDHPMYPKNEETGAPLGTGVRVWRTLTLAPDMRIHETVELSPESALSKSGWQLVRFCRFKGPHYEPGILPDTLLYER